MSWRCDEAGSTRARGPGRRPRPAPPQARAESRAATRPASRKGSGVAGGGELVGGERLVVEPAGPGVLDLADDGARAVPRGASGGLADAHEALLEVAAGRDGPDDGVIDVDQRRGVDDPARQAGVA